jgi:glycosyltransferase involved in cell wall biosynthesis
MTALAQCFTMVKDEADIIEDWIRYHVWLFGAGNVHVLDDESTDGTWDILQHYRPIVKARRVRSSVRGRGKGDLITAAMAHNRGNSKILIPLDADEFIGLQNNWNRDEILRCLTELPVREVGRFKFPLTYQAIPRHPLVSGSHRDITDFHVYSYEFYGATFVNSAKEFYTADSFIQTDGGNHHGTSESPSILMSNLWLYHYPARSVKQFGRKTTNWASHMDYWKTQTMALGAKRAYEADQRGELISYYTAEFVNRQRHRRMSWPGEALYLLDTEKELPPKF